MRKYSKYQNVGNHIIEIRYSRAVYRCKTRVYLLLEGPFRGRRLAVLGLPCKNVGKITAPASL